MKGYSAYTKEDFNDLGNYDLYGFISDTSVTGNEFYDRLNEVYEYAEKLHCLDTYKFCADPLLEKRHFIDEWTVKDKIELLEDDIFHKLIELDDLDRPKAEMLLKEQAEKFRCKTEFSKKLEAVKKMVKLSNIQSIKPIELPFIKVKYIDIMTGKIEYYVSRPVLAEYFRQHNRYFWIGTAGGENPLRYIYRNGVYSRISDDEIRGILKSYITKFDLEILKMQDVEEAFKNICCDNVFCNVDELNADENIINFQNGILHLNTMELTEHSPDLLSTIQIPDIWDPSGVSTPVFNKFMKTLTNGNSEIKQLLLEFMGLAISNIDGSRPKKALFLVGKGNTGKSRPRILLERLLGAQYCSPCNIADLEGRFGTSALYNKRLAGSPDMSAMNVQELKMFKSITGGDSIQVEFKHKDIFSYFYKGVLWFGANEMPKFGGDKGKHVYERMILIPCNNVIPENERDSTIVDKMFEERRGIMVLLVNALKRFINRGYKFIIPEECKFENEKYKIENSSVLKFYNECCCERIKAKDNCTTARMYEVFKAWAKSAGEFAPTKQNFWKELADNFADGDKNKLVKTIQGIQYPIFTITKETKEMFCAVYGYDHV